MENSIEFAGFPISDFIFIIIVYEKNANNNKNIWKFFFEGKWQIKLCHWFLESFLPFQRLLSQIICVFSNQYALGKLYLYWEDKNLIIQKLSFVAPVTTIAWVKWFDRIFMLFVGN